MAVFSAATDQTGGDFLAVPSKVSSEATAGGSAVGDGAIHVATRNQLPS
jgi:hypothetical protein